MPYFLVIILFSHVLFWANGTTNNGADVLKQLEEKIHTYEPNADPIKFFEWAILQECHQEKNKGPKILSQNQSEIEKIGKQIVATNCAENFEMFVSQNAKIIEHFGGKQHIIKVLAASGPEIVQEIKSQEKLHGKFSKQYNDKISEMLKKMFDKLPEGQAKNAVDDLLKEHRVEKLYSDLFKMIFLKLWPSFMQIVAKMPEKCTNFEHLKQNQHPMAAVRVRAKRQTRLNSIMSAIGFLLIFLSNVFLSAAFFNSLSLKPFLWLSILFALVGPAMYSCGGPAQQTYRPWLDNILRGMTQQRIRPEPVPPALCPECLRRQLYSILTQNPPIIHTAESAQATTSTAAEGEEMDGDDDINNEKNDQNSKNDQREEEEKCGDQSADRLLKSDLLNVISATKIEIEQISKEQQQEKEKQTEHEMLKFEEDDEPRK